MRRAVLLVVAACSTGQVAAPKRAPEPDPERAPRETLADKLAKRRKAAEALVPRGSTCLPAIAKSDEELRLEIAALGDSARICAIDINRERLLGPVGCWNIDLTASALAYVEPAPLPARGFRVRMDGACARGFCLRDVPDAKIAQLAWSPDGKGVAVLVERKVYLFDAASETLQSSFSIEQTANSVTAIHYLGTHVLVQAKNAVGMYELDGTQVGAIAGPDNQPLSTATGGLALLDGARVAIGEHGFEEMTVVELASGSKSRLVRKPATKLRCKPAQLKAYWEDPDSDDVSDDCRANLSTTLAPLVGATVIAGRTNFLALLRGDRAGQLAVLDAKTLVEKRAITLPWCEDAETSTNNDDDDEAD